MRDINDKKKMAEQTKARWQFVIVLVVITIGMFMAGAARATSAETFAATNGNALHWAYGPPFISTQTFTPTHRVVSVELLRRAIGREDRMEMVTAFVEIGAIIDNQTTG